MRPFTWHDLPTLYAYRDQIISLDSGFDLTRGSAFLAPAILLDQLDPDSAVFLGVETSQRAAKKLLGRMALLEEERGANLSFLMPQTLSGSSAMTDLVDGLCRQAGEWGAICVRAEVEVGDPIFSTLRKSGFHVYDRQRIWMIEPQLHAHTLTDRKHRWHAADEWDQPAIRRLYTALVPPMVQAAHPLLAEKTPGLLYLQEGELMGYLESTAGPNGICLRPLLHPAIEDVSMVLQAAVLHFLPLLGRPVYITVPAYQGWLESTLYDMRAEVISLRTLMVKYLAQPLRALESEAVLRTIERARVRMRPTHFIPPGSEQ